MVSSSSGGGGRIRIRDLRFEFEVDDSERSLESVAETGFPFVICIRMGLVGIG